MEDPYLLLRLDERRGGIEAPDEEEMLLELGVQYGQGYLFGKPRPLEWKTKVLSD